MLIITCFSCMFQGGPVEFNMSLYDECFCPKCHQEFIIEWSDEEDYIDEIVAD